MFLKRKNKKTSETPVKVITYLMPENFYQPLALTAQKISSAELRALREQFFIWLKSSYVNRDVGELVNARAQFVDLILTKLWHQHGLDKFSMSLVAVGGYGRGELHPYSDVDILILTQKNINKNQGECISAFITQLWDIKLDVGSSVRSVEECLEQAKNDITIATNLMETRSVCGDDGLLNKLQPVIFDEKCWSSQAFFIAKKEEQEKRHLQYHGASYTLEPNLKANPGGLRDIQTIGWVAKRHFHADSLEEIVAHKYLTQNEYNELIECQDYLWRMRFALHFVSGRSENRLLFDYQADVAKFMGFGDEGKAVVERMMKRYFRIIARVAELNKMLLQHFEDEIINKGKPCQEIVIDNNFIIVNGLIKITNKRVFLQPTKIMELFLIIAEHPEIKGLHSETLRVMRNIRRRLVSRLNDYEDCRRIFLEIIKHPRGLGLPFTLMHRHSILSAYLPQWREIVGQMQFDLFHAYSVDEHSFRLIKNLYRFSQPEHNHEFPLCSKIVQRMRKPELLYYAGIFHDIAKGRGGDHSELGAEDALKFAKMHKLNDHEGRMIAWLVRHHLTMSTTAQRKDITDERVIKDFATIVSDEAHLDSLYCLTVADMRATNESLWNDWKANLLIELYDATKKAFRQGLEKTVDLRAKVRENQQIAKQRLAENGFEFDAIKPIWRMFKADYFLRYSPEQIAWHTEKIKKNGDDSPLVLISKKPYRGGTEVFIYTKDKANIFAASVAFLGTKKLSIHDAKIITSKHGYTLNTFVVLDQQNHPIKDEYRIKEIAKSMMAFLAEPELKAIKPQPVPKRLEQFNVTQRVNFGIARSKKYSTLEITTLDRPGLLASIGQVFSDCGINLHTAKITTFGEKAEDVFTVSNRENLALTEQEQQLLAERLTSEINF